MAYLGDPTTTLNQLNQLRTYTTTTTNSVFSQSTYAQQDRSFFRCLICEAQIPLDRWSGLCAECENISGGVNGLFDLVGRLALALSLGENKEEALKDARAILSRENLRKSIREALA